jgi:hypothetical protein
LLPAIYLGAPVDVDEQAAQGIDDAIEGLAELLGVDLNDDSNAAEDGEAADAATQKELKRLLDHLHDPVQPGAQYTVLQVCVCVCGGGGCAWGEALLCEHNSG